jgi:hypothetical protein
MYLLMKLATLALLLLAALALYCLICRCSKKENFFGGLDSFGVSWNAPEYVNPSALTYRWIICPEANAVNPQDPTTWTGSPMQPWSSATSAVVTSDACPTCDFGMTLYFAVQAQDATVSPPSVSPWAITQIPLSGTSGLTGNLNIVDGYTGNALSAGSGSFAISFSLSAPAPPTATAQAFVNVYRPSGGATYTSVSLELSSTGTFDGYFSAQDIWQPIPSGKGTTSPGQPGPLVYGDVVTTTVLVSDPTTVYYYGSTVPQTIGNASVSAPTGITWGFT